MNAVLKGFLRNRLNRVKRVWGEANIWSPGEIRHWLQHPAVQVRINNMVTAGEPGNRYEYFIRHYLEGRLPLECALTLGSGSGELERGLCQYKFASRHEGIDISDEAIRKARAAAAAEGLNHVHYRLGELNSIQLEPRRYDVVFGVSSVHHVEKLERLMDQVRTALKPGGYFFMDEFIGPSRFQWTDEQVRLMNSELDRLPDQLKRRVSQKGKIKRRIERKTVAYVQTADPSEAVRSAEIVPLLRRYFPSVDVRGYGGSLIHELLYDIAGNFNEENPGSLDRLQELFRLEDELIASGRLTHDFAVIIASEPKGADEAT